MAATIFAAVSCIFFLSRKNATAFSPHPKTVAIPVTSDSSVKALSGILSARLKNFCTIFFIHIIYPILTLVFDE